MPESLFLINLQAWGSETLAQVLSWEFCKIFKNNFFIEHLRWLLLPVITEVFWLIRYFKLRQVKHTRLNSEHFYPRCLNLDNIVLALFSFITTEAAFADVLQNSYSKKFRNILRNHLCWSLFMIKLQAFIKRI